jgi:hypothetical protein
LTVVPQVTHSLADENAAAKGPHQIAGERFGKDQCWPAVEYHGFSRRPPIVYDSPSYCERRSKKAVLQTTAKSIH